MWDNRYADNLNADSPSPLLPTLPLLIIAHEIMLVQGDHLVLCQLQCSHSPPLLNKIVDTKLLRSIFLGICYYDQQLSLIHI